MRNHNVIANIIYYYAFTIRKNSRVNLRCTEI